MVAANKTETKIKADDGVGPGRPKAKLAPAVKVEPQVK